MSRPRLSSLYLHSPLCHLLSRRLCFALPWSYLVGVLAHVLHATTAARSPSPYALPSSSSRPDIITLDAAPSHPSQPRVGRVQPSTPLWKLSRSSCLVKCLSVGQTSSPWPCVHAAAPVSLYQAI
jgi:hypothetical protein